MAAAAAFFAGQSVECPYASGYMLCDGADIALDADPLVFLGVLDVGHPKLLSAVVGVFDERHGHDLGRHGFATHPKIALGPVGRGGGTLRRRGDPMKPAPPVMRMRFIGIDALGAGEDGR